MSDLPASFDVADVTALRPAQILLMALFSERLGIPLNGVTQFDIEAAQVSYDIEKKLMASLSAGQPSSEDVYREYLKERLTARRNHQAGKRRAAKINRTPAWADKKAIQAIYDEARRLTVANGIPHHVDHGLPLLGRLVSGLHVETNLQILTGPDNCRKNNRFEIEP